MPWRSLEVEADFGTSWSTTTVLPDLQRFLMKRRVQPPTLSTAATSLCRPTQLGIDLIRAAAKLFGDHPLQRETHLGEFRL
jgi:hypothetical protein